MLKAQIYMTAVLENDTQTLGAIAEGKCDFATVARATLEQFGYNDNVASIARQAEKRYIPN